jgi:hypothetical protein
MAWGVLGRRWAGVGRSGRQLGGDCGKVDPHDGLGGQQPGIEGASTVSGEDEDRAQAGGVGRVARVVS